MIHEAALSEELSRAMWEGTAPAAEMWRNQFLALTGRRPDTRDMDT